MKKKALLVLFNSTNSIVSYGFAAVHSRLYLIDSASCDDTHLGKQFLTVPAAVQKAFPLPRGVLEGLCLSALYLLHADGIQCAHGLTVTAKPF